MSGTATSTHGAGYLYNRLKHNAEFRMLLADRLHQLRDQARSLDTVGA